MRLVCAAFSLVALSVVGCGSAAVTGDAGPSDAPIASDVRVEASVARDVVDPGPATCASMTCASGERCEMVELECDGDDVRDCLSVPSCRPVDAGAEGIDASEVRDAPPVADGGTRADVVRDTGVRDTGVRDTGVRDTGGPIVGDPCRGPNAANVLRVMTFNIKSGQVSNLGAIADVINAARPDIVGLQEVDRNTDRTGHVDQAARLGVMTRMNAVFRPTRGVRGGDFGVALLSRFDIQSATAHDLPAGGFEARIYVDATLNLGGARRMRVGFTHLDFHVEAAQPQVREILRLTADAQPLLILGDFNFTPDRPVYDVMAEGYRDTWTLAGMGLGRTVPATHPGGRIDYLWLSRGPDGLRPLCAYVPDTTASDHRPVVAAYPMP